MKLFEFDEVDEEYFAMLGFGVIISILVGLTFLGVLIMADLMYTFCVG